MSRVQLIICMLGTIAIASFANAGSGGIEASAFGGKKTIIFAETYECTNGIYGLLIKNEDWFGGLSGEGSVLLDSKVVSDAWDLQGAPQHESELVRKIYHDKDFAHIKYESPEYMKLLREAQQKDAAHKTRVLAALAKEHKRAGLKADSETEHIVYFFSGKAKMRVIESLQGDLKPGDEIEVTWKHIQRRISCPPVIPFKGKCGWIFDAKLKNGIKTELGHGFFSLEEGRKAKAKHERGEQDGARQPATAVDSKSEGGEKPKRESKARPR